MGSGVRGVYLKLTTSKRVRGNIKTTAPLLSKMPPDALQFSKHLQQPEIQSRYNITQTKNTPLKTQKMGGILFSKQSLLGVLEQNTFLISFLISFLI